MFETLLRTHEPVSVPMSTIATAVARITEVEKKKESRRDRQIAEAKKRKEESLMVKIEGEEGEEVENSITKRRRDESPPSVEVGLASVVDGQVTGSTVKAETLQKSKSDVLETCKPALMSRGHTSFLTFAILLPETAALITSSTDQPDPSV